MSVFKPQMFRDTFPAEVDAGAYAEECTRLRAENKKLREALDCIPVELMLAAGPPYDVHLSIGALRLMHAALNAVAS